VRSVADAPGDGALVRVLPVPGAERGVVAFRSRPRVMGVLNVTPDSFSDGGRLLGGGVAAAVAAARGMAAAGASVLDLGGQSTRPGAPRVPPHEELARVLPALRAIRACPDLSAVAVSVDTFSADVAAEALRAGASMINDVSAGSLDPRILGVVALSAAPYVAMHMRGHPGSMMSPENTRYGPDPLADVARELGRSVARAQVSAPAPPLPSPPRAPRGPAATGRARGSPGSAGQPTHAGPRPPAPVPQEAGVEPWRVILDPGLGFAKTLAGNLRLLGGSDELREGVGRAAAGTGAGGALRGAPVLVGPSRKRFLGDAAGRAGPGERGPATVAAVAAAVRGGADVVRVHDVRECVDAVRVAAASRWPPWETPGRGAGGGDA